MQSKRILIVEDDKSIAELLALHLSDEGYQIHWVDDGHQGMQQVQEQQWDAIILDLMLPGVDGLDICRQVRNITQYTSIIITSARASEAHRVMGLDLGADDYLAKPFSMVELVARVRALFRRQDAMNQDAQRSGRLVYQGLCLEPLTREVWVDEKPVTLTPREFDLLYFFARHPGEVFSRLQLLEQVWGYQHSGYQHTVNTHINRLRLKIEQHPAEPCYIFTCWGAGYRFGS